MALVLFLARDIVGSLVAPVRRGFHAVHPDRRQQPRRQAGPSPDADAAATAVTRMAAFWFTHRGRALVWLGLWVGASAISAALHPFRWAAWGQAIGLALIPSLMIYEGSRLRWSQVPWTGIVIGTLAATAWGILGTHHYGWTRAPSPLQGVNSFGTLLLLGGGLGFGYLLSRRPADRIARSHAHARIRSSDPRQDKRQSDTNDSQIEKDVWRPTHPQLPHWVAGLLAWARALFPWLFLLAVTDALILTGSRGAWIGFALYAACMLLSQPRARWPVLVALAAGLAALVSHPVLHTRLLSVFSLIANEDRLTIWQTTLHIIRDHPWWGVGPSNFSTVFDLYKPVPELMASSAHNILLTTWAESGVSALLFLVLFGTELLATQFHLVLAKPRDPLRWAILGVTLGVLSHQMVDHTLFSVDLLGLFMGIMGISMGEADRLPVAAIADSGRRIRNIIGVRDVGAGDDGGNEDPARGSPEAAGEVEHSEVGHAGVAHPEAEHPEAEHPAAGGAGRRTAERSPATRIEALVGRNG